jgi:hypothetical protein
MSTKPPPPKPQDFRLDRDLDRMTVDVSDPDIAPSRTPRKLRRLGKLIVILLLAGVGWTSWAAYALYDLASAVQSLDPIALERRMDWTAVQQGLHDDLSNTAVITRQSVAQAVRRARLDAAQSDGGGFWRRIVYAGYSGGPFAFRVDLKPEGGTVDDTMTLLFKWSGDWRLARVFPPGTAGAPAPFAERADAFPAMAPAIPAPPSRPEQPSSEPTSYSGIKATLFEEDAANPEGKRYEGFVSWNTELTTPASSGVQEPVVTAHISMPTRPLSMTLWIRRNSDKALPATHTIEVKFELPDDSTTGGIHDVPGILLKQSENDRGTRLAGVTVNVAENFFLIGLSAIGADVEQNVRLLKDWSWIGLPIAYKNNKRAVLTIEKGPIGEKVIADAIALWSRIAVSEKDKQN